MRPNKIETAVQCFSMSNAMIAGFSGDDNLVYSLCITENIPELIKYLNILWYNFINRLQSKLSLT